LDIWEPDDGGGDEPVLFNGGTLTSKLSLGPVLDLINEMAFERTRYLKGNYFNIFLKKISTLYSIRITFTFN